MLWTLQLSLGLRLLLTLSAGMGGSGSSARVGMVGGFRVGLVPEALCHHRLT